MTSERASAYRRVITTLDQLGPAKLLDEERDLIRYAADTLLFSADPRNDIDAELALGDISFLCRTLVDSGRWEAATAMRLADDIADCGGIGQPARQAA
jgi:hypothetical protein